MIYKADIAGVALKPQESKIIAGWLLGRYGAVNEETWTDLIYNKNEVQIRGRSTLRRQSNLLRARLRLVSTAMLEIVADGSYRETVQACLCAAIKHSRLLGDFIDVQIRNEVMMRNREIDRYHWRQFLNYCQSQDPDMSEWAPNTSIRIQTSVFSILQEGGVLKKDTHYTIQSLELEERIKQQLVIDAESYIQKCLRYEL